MSRSASASSRSVPSLPKIHASEAGASAVTELKRRWATAPRSKLARMSTWSGTLTSCQVAAAASLPPRHRDLGHRRHPLRRAEPAHHRLVPDAHVQDVVPAQRDVVPPVQRARPARRSAPWLGLQLDRQHLAHDSPRRAATARSRRSRGCAARARAGRRGSAPCARPRACAGPRRRSWPCAPRRARACPRRARRSSSRSACRARCRCRRRRCRARRRSPASRRAPGRCRTPWRRARPTPSTRLATATSSTPGWARSLGM